VVEVVFNVVDSASQCLLLMLRGDVVVGGEQSISPESSGVWLQPNNVGDIEGD